MTTERQLDGQRRRHGWCRWSTGLLVFALLGGGAACGGSTAASTRGEEDPALANLPPEPEPDADAPAATPTVRKAERLLSQGDAEGARSAFEQALAEDPKDVRAYLGLGLAAEALGDAAAAENAYSKAIEVEPDFAEAHNNLGVLLRGQGELQAALGHFQNAVQADPQLASAHANLALAYEDLGQPDQARKAYERAVELDPEQAIVQANYGLLLLRQQQDEAALRELRAAWRNAEGNRAALLAIGNGLRRAGSPGEAVQAMQQAIEAGDGQPTAALLSELALAQRGAEEREAARQTLKQAIELDPEYGPAHYLLAGMEASEGRFDAAIQHYQRYLKLEPEGPLARRARERLKAAKAMAKR